MLAGGEKPCHTGLVTRAPLAGKPAAKRPSTLPQRSRPGSNPQSPHPHPSPHPPTPAPRQADLLIALGVRFDDRVTGKLEAFATRSRIVHIDIDPAEIHKNKTAHIPICSGARFDRRV
jgi:thiamine pyrophosphate-dependent acetolactate synthase large subunit-like protein